MGKDVSSSVLVTISIWDKFRIMFLSFACGFAVLFKMLGKWMWDPNSFFVIQQRDSPPSCLVDSTLGQHKYVKLRGVKFHYVESGQRSDPLVLLLHGFPDFWLSWRNQIQFLANQNFRVVALDLKGFGDSDKPLSRTFYRTDLILEELKQFITTLGESSCILMAHDIGALLGWCLAHQHPQLVEALIVISCPHPNVYWESLRSASNYRWVNFAQLPFFPEVDALSGDVKIISDYHKHLTRHDGTYLEAYKYAFSRKEDWTGPLNYLRNLVYAVIAENSTLPRQIPVLLIVGSQDKLVNLESIVRSSDFCEVFRLKIIESAGHFPHQESPTKFNDVVIKFLNKITSRRPPCDENGVIERRLSQKSIVNRMFGAVSTTVKYGNSVLDTVQKKTNGVVGHIPKNINLLNYSSYNQSNTQYQD